MKNININKMTKQQQRDLYLKLNEEIFKESRESNENYIKENTSDWTYIGAKAQKYRESKGITLRELSSYMSKSITTLRNFEQGLPVKYADNIKQSYYKLVELIADRKEMETEKVKLIEKYGAILISIFTAIPPKALTNTYELAHSDLIWVNNPDDAMATLDKHYQEYLECVESLKKLKLVK